MAIDELSQLIHLPISNVPGAPPPKDTPDEETIKPQKSNINLPMIQQRQGLIDRYLEWKMWGGKHMAK